MKRQYIAFSASGAHNSGLKHTIADATKWVEDFLGKNHANVYICETIAMAARQPMPVKITDIPKDDFDANKIASKDVQPTVEAPSGLSKPVDIDAIKRKIALAQ